MKREMKRRMIAGWPGRTAYRARVAERYLRSMMDYYAELANENPTGYIQGHEPWAR